MMKRKISAVFKGKKGLEAAKTIIYVLIAIITILLMGWAIFQAANRIFG